MPIHYSYYNNHMVITISACGITFKRKYSTYTHVGIYVVHLWFKIFDDKIVIESWSLS